MLKRPYLSLTLITGATLAAVFWAAGALVFHLYPEREADAFCLQLELPAGTSMSTTRSALGELETLVRARVPAEDIHHITAKVGELNHCNAFLRNRGNRPSWGILKVHLKPMRQRSSHSTVMG